MSTNDVTGARLVSKVNSKEYEEAWDRIFGTTHKELKQDQQKEIANDKSKRIVEEHK